MSMIFRNNRIMTVVISVILIAIIPFSVQAGVKLRVWDNGGSPDDEADVYFDNNLLGRSAATSEGTTWDLGELATGPHELKIIHKVDEHPPGTYAWELSGGGISANDDGADVDTDSSVEIEVLDNDTLAQTSAGDTPTLDLEEEYTTTIQVDDASDELTISSITNSPSQGNAQIGPDSKVIKYTPDSDSCGADSFTYEASDGSGNTGTATVEVTLNDKTPPDLDTPADKTISCEESTDPSNTGEANATDNCEVDAVTYSDSSSGTCPTVITRTWEATDSSGNSVSEIQTITVEDNTPPEIETPADDKTVECDGNGNPTQLNNWLDNHGGARASDECDDDLTWSNDFTGLSDLCGETGEAYVTFTVTDNCENSSSTTATFTIEDKTEPTWDQTMPADTTVECDEVPTAPTVTASDTCGSTNVNYSESRTDGTCANSYTLTRTWVATDTCGNSVSHEQVITVRDTTAPLAVDNEYAISDQADTVLNVLDNDSDNCSENLYLESVSSPSYGEVQIEDNKIRYKPTYGYVGEVEFSYTVRDECNNQSEAKVRISVGHENNPPEADANGPYMAIPGQTVLLDGSGSTDPDTQDRLQYRWDINNDGIYETDWRDESSYKTSWDESYQGQVVLQVRDLFRGAPTGDTSTDESSVSIEDQFGPKIELTVSGPEEVKPGEEFTFSILTTNRGSMDAINTKLSLALPDVFEVTNADPRFTGEEPYTWEIGRISPDESTKVELTIGAPLSVPEEGGPVFPVEASLNYLTARGAEMPTVSESLPIELVAGPRIDVEVFRDENGDGKREEGEAGLSKIPIALSDVNVSTTDKKGRVIFRGIEPGIYPVSIAEKGLERLDDLNLVVSKAKQEVKLEGEETITVSFPVSSKWGQVSGFVFNDANENGKKDEGEKGIANLQLTLDGQEKATTDSSGQFQFMEITPGDHTLLVKADSGQTRTVNFSLKTGDSLSLEIPWVIKTGGFLNVQIGKEGGE